MFKARNFSLPLGKKTYVMGVLNYTPDSFSDGGKFNTPEQALAHALKMQEQGADIIDLGANSTRPGAETLTATQELERIMPALEALKGKLDVPLSVDTFYPLVAKAALEAGAEDFNFDGDVFEITTEPNDLGAVRDALEEQGYSFLSAEVQYVPSTTTAIDDPDLQAKMEKLIDMLEDNDDVQAIWHNWEMPDEE